MDYRKKTINVSVKMDIIGKILKKKNWDVK
jgi:hypothetical protein